MATSTFYLVDEEAILLDGRCRPEVQEKVEAAKLRLAAIAAAPDVDRAIIEAVSNAVRIAREKYILYVRGSGQRYCDVCKVSAGYSKWKRGSYKHKKGSDNRDKPLQLYGVRIAEDYFACRDCYNKILPLLRVALEDVQAEIPEDILGYPCNWKRIEAIVCVCGWDSRNGKHIERLMNDRSHMDRCPECNARNNWGNTPQPLKHLEEYFVVPIPMKGMMRS